MMGTLQTQVRPEQFLAHWTDIMTTSQTVQQFLDRRRMKFLAIRERTTRFAQQFRGRKPMKDKCKWTSACFWTRCAR